MKIDICYFIEAERVPAGAKRQKPSKGFDKAWKRQVFDKIVPTLEEVFPAGSIKICQTDMMSFAQHNTEVVGVIRRNDVLFDGFLSLFDFDIFWKNVVDGSKALPTDEISEDHLFFWMERFPTVQEITAMRDRNDHLVQIVINRKRREGKNYRFSLKVREVGEMLKFAIKTHEPECKVEEFIGDLIHEWNMARPDRLIHDFYLTERKKGTIFFLFNWGSATDEAMDFIFDKLNGSSLEIRSITVTSEGF